MTIKIIFTFLLSAFLTACAPASFGFNKASDSGNLTSSSVSTPDLPNEPPTPTPDPTPPGHTPCPNPSDKGLYLCILNGPGKNTRIGYVDNELTAANGAPTDVCMSQNACLNIASKAFPVTADFSHPCPGLLHNVAIQMSDNQIQTLIDKLLKP